MINGLGQQVPSRVFVCPKRKIMRPMSKLEAAVATVLDGEIWAVWSELGTQPIITCAVVSFSVFDFSGDNSCGMLQTFKKCHSGRFPDSVPRSAGGRSLESHGECRRVLQCPGEVTGAGEGGERGGGGGVPGVLKVSLGDFWGVQQSTTIRRFPGPSRAAFFAVPDTSG